MGTMAGLHIRLIRSKRYAFSRETPCWDLIVDQAPDHFKVLYEEKVPT